MKHRRHDIPDSEKRMIEFGWMWMQILFPDMGTAGQESCAWNEKEMEDNHPCDMMLAQEDRLEYSAHPLLWTVINVICYSGMSKVG